MLRKTDVIKNTKNRIYPPSLYTTRTTPTPPNIRKPSPVWHPITSQPFCLCTTLTATYKTLQNTVDTVKTTKKINQKEDWCTHPHPLSLAYTGWVNITTYALIIFNKHVTRTFIITRTFTTTAITHSPCNVTVFSGCVCPTVWLWRGARGSC